MGLSLARRHRFSMYFRNLVRMKLSGQISQQQLEQFTSRQRAEDGSTMLTTEQLTLGIVAVTETTRR